jgi:hypothetical protein
VSRWFYGGDGGGGRGAVVIWMCIVRIEEEEKDTPVRAFNLKIILRKVLEPKHKNFSNPLKIKRRVKII